MDKALALILGLYLTVTSIEVCDGGECFYPIQMNRPGFTGDCLVLLKRLYLARSGLHSMPPLPQLVLYIRLVRAGDDC